MKKYILLVALILLFAGCLAEEAQPAPNITKPHLQPLPNMTKPPLQNITNETKLQYEGLAAQPKIQQNIGECCRHPYYHSVFRATSKDGKIWTAENKLLIEHASVPHPVRLENGSIVIYYVNGTTDTFDCSITDDGINYYYGDCKLYNYTGEKAWDPYVIAFNGKYRLFFFGPQKGVPPEKQISKIYSAISDDGINFILEPGVRFEEEGITDPAVIFANNKWKMYTGKGTYVVVAESSDGYTFTKVGEYNTGGSVPDILLLDDSTLLLFICASKGIVYITPPEIGKSEAEVAIPQEIGYITCDPGIVKLSDGTYVMYYKKQPMEMIK